MANSILLPAVHLRLPAALLGLLVVTALLVGGEHPFAAGLVPTPWDKLAHVLAYAVLALAIGLASGRTNAWLVGLGFIGALGVGVVDEFLQMGYAGREADFEDLLADAVGAALGTLPLAVMLHRRQEAVEHDHHHQ